MKGKHQYIIAALLLGLCLLSSCSKKDSARVIPRNVFSKIYAEMFVADQWMLSNSAHHQFPDTTLYYEPIFNKYGYTTDDYLRSIDYYLYDPDRFARIIDKAVSILEDRKAEIMEDSGEEIKIEDGL